jgi:three-Cys-motif partner protein
MKDPRSEIRVDSDDLRPCPPVGPWAETKYELISTYAELFAKGMKAKWESRVYIDLYAGAGYSQIDGTSITLKGSPILALSVTCPFDKYIFCEENPENMAALRERVRRVAPNADVSFVEGKCDEMVEQICNLIPKPSRDRRVLSLCFVDPYDFGIRHQTLKKLSKVFMDFLVLLAIGMDANRNYDHYVDGNSQKIDLALGNTEWRDRWKGHARKDFRTFLATEFAASMESLGYKRSEVYDMKLVRSNEKNLPLYYLALFSRHDRGSDFWRKVLDYNNDQPKLF